jgi:hypothetical protein
MILRKEWISWIMESTYKCPRWAQAGVEAKSAATAKTKRDDVCTMIKVGDYEWKWVVQVEVGEVL